MLMTLQSKAILLITGNAKLLSNDLCFIAHMNIFKCTPQAIMHHTIDDLTVAHAVSCASFGQKIGSIAHALHATGDEGLSIASSNSLSGLHYSLQTRAAYLIN